MSYNKLDLKLYSLNNDIIRYRKKLDYRLGRLDSQTTEILNLVKLENSDCNSVQNIIYYPFYILNLVLIQPGIRGFFTLTKLFKNLCFGRL